MRKLTLILSILLVVAITASMCACGTTSEQDQVTGDAPSEETVAAETNEEAPTQGSEEGTVDKPLIAFSQGSQENPWRVTNSNDMEEWVLKSGYDYVMTDAKLDSSKQLSDVESLLAQNPDVLIVAPITKEAGTPIAQMATEAGVPLIVIDRMINAEVGEGTFVATISQNWVDLGRIQGEYAVEALTEKYGEPKGRIVEISGLTGAAPAIDESKGIREILDQYPDIEIIDAMSGDYTREKTKAVMQDMLQKHPKDTIDLVIIHGDDMAIGAIQAIKDSGRDELLGNLICKDGDVNGLKNIIDGIVICTVQVPPYYGEQSMELVKKILAGEEIENPEIDLQVMTFDMKDNKQQTLDYYDYLVENDLLY